MTTNTAALKGDFTSRLRCAHRFSKFLRGEREAIARAVAVDASQHRRKSEDAVMDSQRELHKLRVMFADQRSVDRLSKHPSYGRGLQLARALLFANSWSQPRIVTGTLSIVRVCRL